MTNTQLYLAIGVPIVLNTALVGMMYFLLRFQIDSGLASLRNEMNARFEGAANSVNAQFAGINRRFDDMRDLWRAELRRVEEVLDARLKHVESYMRDAKDS